MVSPASSADRSGFGVAGRAAGLFVGDNVRRQELIVTGHDGYARFEVADGSTFEVFPDSKVVFHDNPTPTTRICSTSSLAALRYLSST